MTPDVEGTVDRRYETVREAFAEVLAAQEGNGAAVAIWHDGAWVADLWGGPAYGGVGGSGVGGGSDRRWVRDSIAMPYSVTKPFTAVCALLLVQRGQLDLDAPMQRYWQQFRARATVRDVLSHQAGVVALDASAPTEIFYDWNALCALLAGQAPEWEPGTAHGESALFYGHLVGELVHRIDGRSVGRFLREEVCGPLGLDFAVGLSAGEQARAVDLTGLDEYREANADAHAALYRRAIANPPGAQEPAVVNGAAWRAAEVPAVNGHGTARGVAGLYSALLRGELLSASVLQEATTTQCSGMDLVMGAENAWGLGFGVDDDGFGMGGLGGSVGWASTAGGYALGFVTATMGGHDRAGKVENAFRECIGVPLIS
jgi:CubicO group peptidase (beta-lactamase class C family)